MKKMILSLMFLTLSVCAEEVYATFTVEAEQSAQLAFNASGIVNKVNVEIGSVVKEDDILASLDSEDINASLQIARTALKYAKKDYDRQLKVKHIIDEASLDQFASRYENAKAQVIYQQVLLDQTILRSPFDGIIFWKEVEIGDTVSGMMLKTVLKLQSRYERKLVLAFDQKHWKAVKVGNTFKYRVDGDTAEYEGKISKIYPYANVDNRKIEAEVYAKDLPVGLFGEGYIMTETK